MYIIKKIEADSRKRRFVARSGSKHSYTAIRENARQYVSIEDATRDMCPGNERVIKY